MRTFGSIVVTLATICVSSRVSAQQPPATDAALVHVQGEVYLDDRAVEAKPGRLPVPDPVVLRTSRGRAAMALKRGGLLFLDAGTSVRVLANGGYSFDRIEVLTGSAIVASATGAPLVNCENDVRPSNAGWFRFDVQRMNSSGERMCRVRVFEGGAAVSLLSVATTLRAGQTMMCNRRCGDHIPTMGFSREQLDDFDYWARRMDERLRK